MSHFTMYYLIQFGGAMRNDATGFFSPLLSTPPDLQ